MKKKKLFLFLNQYFSIKILKIVKIKFKIFYSNYNAITIKTEPSENEEYFIPNESHNRFKKENPFLMNPPSATLHVSNIHKEISEEELIKIF